VPKWKLKGGLNFVAGVSSVNNMRRTILFSILVITFLLVGIFIYKNKVINPRSYIAEVAGEGIKRSDYKKELIRTKHFFAWAKQDISKLPSLEKDILERMIETKIVTQYARKNNIIVDQKEIETRFTALLGKKSEPEYLATIKEMYGMKKSDYWQKLSEEILKEKVQKHLQKPLAPWLEEMKKAYTVVPRSFPR